MHNKKNRRIVSLILLLLFLLSGAYLAYSRFYSEKIIDSPNKPTDKANSISATLSFVSSPYIISNTYLTEDDIKKINGTNVMFSPEKIEFAGISCNLELNTTTTNTLDYFIENYKVLKDPNNPQSSSSRTLLPEEVGLNSGNVLIKKASCGEGEVTMFNEIDSKKIFVEYKNTFFKLTK